MVGQKGIGKSALFRIAIFDQKEQGEFPIMIKPDDVAEIGEKHESLIISIKKWKFGLTDVIAKKVLSEIGLIDDNITARIIKVGGKLIPLITESLEKLKPQASPSQIDKINRFLKNKKIIVYLDDLDRGWQNRKEGLIMISALINSIRDMSSENSGIIFKLALRSDVFNAVRTEDESSDKFEGTVLWHSYSLHEIFVMLVKRVLTFENKPVNEMNLINSSQKYLAHNLDSVFESKFLGQGKWKNTPMSRVILSLIRNRPRDLIKLCTKAANQAKSEKASIIKSSHILTILPEYSKSIINDAIAEYKSELPQIERLIYGMRPTKKHNLTELSYVFTTGELHTKIFTIMQQGRFQFASGKIGDTHTLSSFLYKINFITARKTLEDGTIKRLNYEEDSSLSRAFVQRGYDWEIHLAYRWVLQPDTLDDIFARIKI